jgi:hypothetical protein
VAVKRKIPNAQPVNRVPTLILLEHSRGANAGHLWPVFSLLGEVVRVCGLFLRKQRKLTFVPAAYLRDCFALAVQCCLNMVRGRKKNNGSPLKLRLARVFSNGSMTSTSQPSSPTSPQRHSFHSTSLESLRFPSRPQ